MTQAPAGLGQTGDAPAAVVHPTEGHRFTLLGIINFPVIASHRDTSQNLRLANVHVAGPYPGFAVKELIKRAGDHSPLFPFRLENGPINDLTDTHGVITLKPSRARMGTSPRRMALLMPDTINFRPSGKTAISPISRARSSSRRRC